MGDAGNDEDWEDITDPESDDTQEIAPINSPQRYLEQRGVSPEPLADQPTGYVEDTDDEPMPDALDENVGSGEALHQASNRSSSLAGTNLPQQSRIHRPTPVLNFLSAELPYDMDIRDQERIDHSKYPRLAIDVSTTGWLPLIDAAWDDENMAKSSLSQEITKYQWILECDEAFAGIHDEVLNIYMTDNPAQLAANDADLASAIDKYDLRSKYHASIYIRQLTVGQRHDNLTIEEALSLAMVVRQYVNAEPGKWNEACRIDQALYGDQWKSEHSEEGYRALITNDNGEVSLLKKHVMLTWADALEKLAKQVRDDQKSHVRSLYYVGYSSDAQEREAEHGNTGLSTNMLIQFAWAVLSESDWCKADTVTITTKAVCLLSGVNVAPVAEALLARLTRSYHLYGGFNIQPCGANVQSAYESGPLPEDKETMWMDNRRWLHQNTSYWRYLDDETTRRATLQRRDWVQRENALIEEGNAEQARISALQKKRDQMRENTDWDI
jgi:hypothetical protein